MILDVGLEVIVVITGECEVIVETDFESTWLNFSSPVGDAIFAKAEMPLANMSGPVALVL